MIQLVAINDIKTQFPDEWVLLGNPLKSDDGINILSGIPIYHSKDKKEVCYIGREKAIGYDKITLFYTGVFKPMPKLTGVFNRIKK